MAENKMTDVNRMIRELEEADIDDDGVCVRYFPYKRDVPILVNALKMYRGFMAENKMEVVAALFGKELGEEFDVRFNGKLKCLMFDEQRGLIYFDGDEWRKNYAYLDWLVRGKAVIVGD